jgi:hypothetical protein
VPAPDRKPAGSRSGEFVDPTGVVEDELGATSQGFSVTLGQSARSIQSTSNHHFILPRSRRAWRATSFIVYIIRRLHPPRRESRLDYSR